MRGVRDWKVVRDRPAPNHKMKAKFTMATNSLTIDLDAGADLKAVLTAPDAPRALLVHLDSDGLLAHTPVNQGQSLVNIEDDLIDHLNSSPHSDEWLISLRDYCDGRLAARQRSRTSGGISLPMQDGSWNVVQHATQGRA